MTLRERKVELKESGDPGIRPGLICYGSKISISGNRTFENKMGLYAYLSVVIPVPSISGIYLCSRSERLTITGNAEATLSNYWEYALKTSMASLLFRNILSLKWLTLHM